MVTSPSIYLLDEPTSGLGTDETAARAVTAGVDAAPRSIVATHDPQVMTWCDEVFELADGTLRELRR